MADTRGEGPVPQGAPWPQVSGPRNADLHRAKAISQGIGSQAPGIAMNRERSGTQLSSLTQVPAELSEQVKALQEVVDTLIGKIGEFTQGCRELKEDGIEGLIVASLDLTKLLKSTPNSFQTIREPPSSLPGWSKSKFDHCKLIADRFTDLDGELQRFLENLEYLAAKIEVFEYFKSTIELFQLGLRNRALYLRVDDNIPTDNRENLIFIHGLPITLGDEIKELNNAFGSLITSGLPAIKRKQNSENFRIRVVTTMATLFAGVTATTLQMSLSIPDSNPFMARVNMLWFWSLAFAIGAAMNGFLDQSRKLIMPDLTYGERRHWVRAWIGTSGPLFMAFSILCFSIGLVAFAYGSSQEKFTSDSTVFVTVFTYLPVITFAVYALWSWYTHVSSPAAPKRSSRKRIKIPEIDDIVCFDTLNIYGPVRDLEYSPDGSLLAVTYYNEDIKKSHTICYEADDELYDAIYQYAHAGRSTALAWSKDGCKFFVRFEDKIDIFSVSKKKGSPPDITCVRFKYRFIQSVVWCHPGDSSGSTTVADLLCAQGDSLYKLTTSPSSEPDSKGSPKMKLHTFHNLYLQNLAVVPGEPNLVLILAQVSTETKVLPNDNALRRVTTRISRKENVDVEGNTLARWRGELGDAARDAGKSEDDVEIIAPTKGRFVHQLVLYDIKERKRLSTTTLWGAIRYVSLARKSSINSEPTTFDVLLESSTEAPPKLWTLSLFRSSQPYLRVQMQPDHSSKEIFKDLSGHGNFVSLTGGQMIICVSKDGQIYMKKRDTGNTKSAFPGTVRTDNY